MSPWLTLDESTLFYWTLSSSYKKQKNYHSAINDWASEILTVNSAGGSSSFSHPNVSSSKKLSGGNSRLSVLSKNIKVISRQPDVVKVKAERSTEPGLHDQDGGLSDNDEIMGNEREVAINSPPKGKKRVTSEVFSFMYCSLNMLT
jgi:hypothetical protein